MNQCLSWSSVEFMLLVLCGKWPVIRLDLHQKELKCTTDTIPYICKQKRFKAGLSDQPSSEL